MEISIYFIARIHNSAGVSLIESNENKGEGRRNKNNIRTRDTRIDESLEDRVGYILRKLGMKKS